MSRISMTEECALALTEARWATRAECLGDLLAAALDGDSEALEALSDAWPEDTSGPRTFFPYVRAEVMDGLVDLALEAPSQPRRRGPPGAGIDGISELVRRHRED